jgi:hypothetical protein
MTGVICGNALAPIDPASLRYSADFDEGTWWTVFQDVEIAVVGEESAPHAIRFEVARRVVLCVDAFVKEANDYLAAFVDKARLEADGNWEADGLVFGRRQSDSVDDFDLTLNIEGDTYGRWTVRFQLSGPPLDRYFPVEFSRRQC